MKRVKTILMMGFLILPAITMFSQVDSTTIYYREITNNELITICDLSGIQIEKIFCKDTLLRGKVFNIIIKEYKKGKICSEKNLNIKAEEQRIPMKINGKSITYIIDFTDKTGFGNSTDSLSLTFAGLWYKNNFKLIIRYPGMSFTRTLKGKSNYSLRPANSCSESELKVPINKEYPILVYTPPFDTGTKLRSYCLLGEEDVLNWYEKFNVKHYYVFYIEIK
ncbi:MAG: hypothetical protein FWD60_00085 [Candidatus Azobacteroides sp.]|nr:hypothetical protein [Candidatus Azobacteroides sp.]